MKIEHLAFQVADSVRAGDWYAEHLGMTIKRAEDVPPFGRFLADASDRVMLEFYSNPAVPVPDYHAVDPLTLHLAFATDDVAGTRTRLIAAGATAAGEVQMTPSGDRIAMLRDPWGLPVQLVTRSVPMI